MSDGPVGADTARTHPILRSWPVHNLVAHPLSEILHWLGFDWASNKVHDGTLPEHEAGTGRG